MPSSSKGASKWPIAIAALVRSGIPTMGHLGLTPQSASALGGFRVQGKGALQAKKIVDDAKALEEAGAYSILLEMVPDRVCKVITERARNCFIISLGSGPDAHGQLLIYHDMFGLYPRFKPRMAKVFADAGKVIQGGLDQYVKEVTEHIFPQPENWFQMTDEEYQRFCELLKQYPRIINTWAQQIDRNYEVRETRQHEFRGFRSRGLPAIFMKARSKRVQQAEIRLPQGWTQAGYATSQGSSPGPRLIGLIQRAAEAS